MTSSSSARGLCLFVCARVCVPSTVNKLFYKLHMATVYVHVSVSGRVWVCN